MIAFGFSAFLKLTSLSERQQRTVIKSRLMPSGGGYDFHKSLRRCVNRLLVAREPISDILNSVDGINNIHERKSVRDGLGKLIEWRAKNPGEIVKASPVIYESPTKLFRATFTADFCVTVGGRLVGVHAWNTKTPKLIDRTVYATLALFYDNRDDELGRSDLGVLSLRTGEFFHAHHTSEYLAIGYAMAHRLEALIMDATDELSRRPVAGPPRPIPPPP